VESIGSDICSVHRLYLADVPHEIQVSAHLPETLDFVPLQLPGDACVALQPNPCEAQSCARATM
jgi:hypothetical protein